MSEELKNKFKNGMIPDEVAFGQLIDEATKETDLSGYATKEEIPVVPDVSEFITLEDIPETDLSEYAKLTDIPSLTGLLSESDADALYVRKDNLPNFEEYAKKTDIPVPQDISHLATKSEIPDVSSFITLEEIPPTDLSEYAKVSDIPSLDGLLSSANAELLYVKKSELPDFNSFANKSEIPDISGLATKEEIPTVPDVSQFITLDDVPEVDLKNYPTKNEVSATYIKKENFPEPEKIITKENLSFYGKGRRNLIKGTDFVNPNSAKHWTAFTPSRDTISFEEDGFLTASSQNSGTNIAIQS